MIAHLSGTLREKQATSVILDVGGVGYEVTIPVTTFFNMEEPGSQVQLRIYTHVREDTLQLFGFRTPRERELFTLLISVTGIGPKSGIAMLSGMSADEIVTAIRTNNLARLTSIPGVGRKTAERLVIELRDKMAALSSPALDAEIEAGAGLAAAPSEDALREDT
ncbi:MAG TPA: Holliday junction branch migration protein RuvA, partial [Pyrinomonadaceae bacterium]